MRKLIPLLAVLLVCPIPATAQNREDRSERRERNRGEQRGRRMGQRLDWFARELNLDEVQKQDFDEIMQAQRERMREMRPHWEAIREARRNGEHERAQELQAQLGDQANPRDLFRQAFDELEPILDDTQYERLQEMRSEMRQRADQRREDRRMAEELPDELGMDEQQRAEYEQLLETRRDQRRARWEEMRPLFEEMRQAEEAGDTQRVEELREQFRDARPDPDTNRKGFLDDVSKIVGESQKPLLETYYLDIGITNPHGESKSADVRTVLLAARRVRVSGETKAQISVIGKEAMRELRKVRRDAATLELTDEQRASIRASRGEATKSVADELRRQNGEAVSAVAKKTRQRIVKLLTPDQVDAFERELDKAMKQASRRK